MEIALRGKEAGTLSNTVASFLFSKHDLENEDPTMQKVATPKENVIIFGTWKICAMKMLIAWWQKEHIINVHHCEEVTRFAQPHIHM